MPTKITWNNSSDCHEFVATPPFNKDELYEAGFPTETADIIHDINGFVLNHCKTLPKHPKLSNFIKEAITSQLYVLVRETPEDCDLNNERYFLSFGRNDKWEEYPVSIRLGLNRPDWDFIKNEVGFIPDKNFQEFTESFPGLVFGLIEFPEFIMPSEYFTNISPFLSQNFTGSYCIPKVEHDKLKNYLFFQHDYWSISRFINKDGTVFELKESPFSFTNTGIYFKDWVYNNVAKWDEPNVKPST